MTGHNYGHPVDRKQTFFKGGLIYICIFFVFTYICIYCSFMCSFNVVFLNSLRAVSGLFSKRHAGFL